MKKVFCLILLLTGYGINLVYPVNPIPSYNVPVYHAANFQETRSTGGITSIPSRGERQMVVRVKGSTSSTAIIWVYSLDLQDILGPFTVQGGETIYVEIDEREWGVIVQSEDHVEVDVWIEEGRSLNSGSNGMNPGKKKPTSTPGESEALPTAPAIGSSPPREE